MQNSIHVGWGLKILYDDAISDVDDVFDQWNTKTSTPMKEIYGLQCWKLEPIC